MAAGAAARATTVVDGLARVAVSTANYLDDAAAEQIEIAEAPNFWTITQDDRYLAGVIRRRRVAEDYEQHRAIETVEAAGAIDLGNLTSSSSGGQDTDQSVRLRPRDRTVSRPHWTILDY